MANTWYESNSVQYADVDASKAVPFAIGNRCFTLDTKKRYTTADGSTWVDDTTFAPAPVAVTTTSGGGGGVSSVSGTAPIASSGGATPAISLNDGGVTLAKMATLAANSFLGNNTGSPVTPIALTVAQAKALLALVKADVGLTNANDTSDAQKPVSTAQQTALDLKANLAGPTFTGVVTLPAKTVTLAMQADMATASVLYRKTAATGVPEVQTLATLKTDLGLTGTNSGDQTITLTGDVTGSGVGSFVTAIKASASLTTPVIGVATGTSLAVTGALSSSGTAGIGYATGAGGAVTQATSRTTGVTLNKISGAITTNTTSLAAGAEAEFTVTNSTVAIGDVILLSARSGQTAGTSIPFVTAVAAGSFKITLSNHHASTADTGAMIINFVVLKAVSA